MSALPTPGEVLPHAGTMVLLDEIVFHEADRTRCALEVREGGLFPGPRGGVPAWVAIEYMAQCAATHAGLLARARGHEPERGFLLGTRELRLHRSEFRPAQRLMVEARHARGERGLVNFDCEVRDRDGQALAANALLNLYVFGEALGGG